MLGGGGDRSSTSPLPPRGSDAGGPTRPPDARMILDSTGTDAYSGRARRTARTWRRDPAGGGRGMTRERAACVASAVLALLLVLGCAPAAAPAAPPTSPVPQPAASAPSAAPVAQA